jgi:hypothetical protein
MLTTHLFAPLGALLADASNSSISPAATLSLLAGYVLLILMAVFGLIILVQMIRGKIDLTGVIGEFGGGASMSRFQLLIFTFVVALSLVMLVATTGRLPDIPTGLMTLLGISGSTYAVSKGIQATMPTGSSDRSESGATQQVRGVSKLGGGQ